MTSFRPATPADAQALMEVERAAGLAAHAHIFPPHLHPYPSDDVLARWHRVLADGQARTLVASDDDGLTCFVCFDSTSVRHLAVRPDQWGRGLARAALAATAGLPTRLWCLRDNVRALGMYEHLGWQRTGIERPGEWPPYPIEVELRRDAVVNQSS